MENEIRFNKKTVKLTNQDIIELGYMAKECIDALADQNVKLTFDETNCFRGVAATMRELIPKIDPEYRNMHRDLCDVLESAQNEKIAPEEGRPPETSEDEFLENMASGIFHDIGHIQGSISRFDWHGEGRDRKFFTLKLGMDRIWRRILEYRSLCYEESLHKRVEAEVQDIFTDPCPF